MYVNDLLKPFQLTLLSGLVVLIIFFFQNQLPINHSRHGACPIYYNIFSINESQIKCSLDPLWLGTAKYVVQLPFCDQRRHLLSTNNKLGNRAQITCRSKEKALGTRLRRLWLRVYECEKKYNIFRNSPKKIRGLIGLKSSFY